MSEFSQTILDLIQAKYLYYLIVRTSVYMMSFQGVSKINMCWTVLLMIQHLNLYTSLCSKFNSKWWHFSNCVSMATTWRKFLLQIYATRLIVSINKLWWTAPILFDVINGVFLKRILNSNEYLNFYLVS